MNKNFLVIILLISGAYAQAASAVTDEQSKKTIPALPQANDSLSERFKKFKADVTRKSDIKEKILGSAAGVISGCGMYETIRRNASDTCALINDVPEIEKMNREQADAVMRLQSALQTSVHGRYEKGLFGDIYLTPDYVKNETQAKLDQATQHKRELEKSLEQRKKADRRRAIIGMCFKTVVGAACINRFAPAIINALSPALRAIQVR